jgi:hypothetical protein
MNARTPFQQMDDAARQVLGEHEYLSWAIALHDVEATRKSVAAMRNLLQRITLACELAELERNPNREL